MRMNAVLPLYPAHAYVFTAVGIVCAMDGHADMPLNGVHQAHVRGCAPSHSAALPSASLHVSTRQRQPPVGCYGSSSGSPHLQLQAARSGPAAR